MAWICVVLGLAGPAWSQAVGKKFRGFGDTMGLDSQEAIVSVKAQFTSPTKIQSARLFITATTKAGWHIYSITQIVKDLGPRPTTIKVDESSDYRVTGAFQAVQQPAREKQKVFNDLVVETHDGEVTWYAPLELRAGVDPAGLKIKGVVKAQPCSESSCMPPTEYPFVASLGSGIAIAEPEKTAALPLPTKSPLPEKTVGPESVTSEPEKAAALPFSAKPPAPEKTTAKTPPAKPRAAFDPKAVVVSDEQEVQNTSFLEAILLGFLGGLILNVMPCVLPVIGLKLFSFMQQAGQDRGQCLVLNIWYSIGLIAVFEVLAILAISLDLGWGALFTYNGFSVAMASIVFAMGLSFLGVWEIPIPGFIGRGAANELANREGALGAVTKGALTTLLATPCSGPFLGSALLWTARQPAPTTFAVFTAMGVGMASPYLLIGAFPQLIRFLPKPGAWMETFKQFLGFVLLATVVYVLSFLEWPYMVPTIGLLFGIWMACWWIGRTPLTLDFQARLRAWLVAGVIIGLAWLVNIGWLLDVMRSRFDAKIDEAVATRVATKVVSQASAIIDSTARQMAENQVAGNRTEGSQVAEKPAEGIRWQPFTRKGFEDLVAAEKTVMIDFTADWCLTCKTLEAAVLDTEPVRALIDANRIVALKADWTHRPKEVTEMLTLLGSKQVPVVAIFPAGEPNRPIRLLGAYTRETLLEAMRKAGPSKTAAM